MAQWVTHSPRNTEDVVSNPGEGRYIVARMTTLNGGPLSMGPIASGKLNKLKDVDKWSSLSLFQLGEYQVLESLGCTCTVRWVI